MTTEITLSATVRTRHRPLFGASQDSPPPPTSMGSQAGLPRSVVHLRPALLPSQSPRHRRDPASAARCRPGRFTRECGRWDRSAASGDPALGLRPALAWAFVGTEPPV